MSADRGNRASGEGVVNRSAELIEAYLDELLSDLRGTAGDVRRILAETEAHLYEALNSGLTDGLTWEAAQTRALDRFGKPTQIARRFQMGYGFVPSWAVLAELASRLWLMAGIGFAAIGLSGLLAWAMTDLGGRDFVFGGGSVSMYAPANCARYLDLHPFTHTCAAAVLAENVSDGLEYRAMAAALAVLLLGSYAAWRWLRRRNRRLFGFTGQLPASVSATLGAGLFGSAAVVLLGQGLNLDLIGRSAGSGLLLAGGIVALPIALAYGLRLVRTLGHSSPAAHPSGHALEG